MIRKILNMLIFSALIFIAGNLFAQTALPFGTLVKGDLNYNGKIFYSVRPTQNSLIIIETFSDIDTLLAVIDEKDEVVMSNDDGGEELNAKIIMLASANKTYRIRLSGVDDDSGPFSIKATSTPIPQAATMRFDNPVSGTLSAGEFRLFGVRSSQTGIITVETTGDEDTYIEVYDTSYNFLVKDDDGGRDENARVEIQAQANEAYYIILRFYSGDTSGPFNITAKFEKVEVPVNTSRSAAAPLNLGEVAQLNFGTGSYSLWYSYRQTRDAAFVVYTRGYVDTEIVLYDSRGNVIAEDDDSGDGGNAWVQKTLSSGTYFIEVKPYSGGRGRATLHTEIR